MNPNSERMQELMDTQGPLNFTARQVLGEMNRADPSGSSYMVDLNALLALHHQAIAQWIQSHNDKVLKLMGTAEQIQQFLNISAQVKREMSGVYRINALIEEMQPEDRGQVSDGYHSFNELYDHRCLLYLLLCRVLSQQKTPPYIWKSKAHSDESAYIGWFILGINTEAGKQITYHLPEHLWNRAPFAMVLQKAPDWDGHSSADVLHRLNLLLCSLEASTS